MTPTTKRVVKTVVAFLLVTLGGLITFDYLAAHTFGPAVRYQLETTAGRSSALVQLGEPDDGYLFNGNDGYVWEVKPVQIGESGAVLDIRIRHLDHTIVGMDEARQGLKNVEAHRFTLPAGQSINVTIEGAKPAVLTSLPL
jgi:hypothetical protein